MDRIGNLYMPKNEKKWYLAVIILLAGACVFFATNKMPSLSNANAQLGLAQENGILVVPMQIDRESYGVAMVDTINQNIWFYRLDNRGQAFDRLQLFAARTFKYDRLLQKYNTAEPKPEQVKILLDELLKNKENK